MIKVQLLALFCLLATVQSQSNQTIEHSNCISQCLQVCFCENGAPDCKNTLPATVLVKKGETFRLSVIAVNQAGKPINATISSSLKLANDEIGSIKGYQHERQIEDRCTELEFTIFSSNDHRAVIVINAEQDDYCDEQNISKREVNISFIPFSCPAGLVSQSRVIDYTCVCNHEMGAYAKKCSVENDTVEMVTTLFTEWIKYEYINDTESWFFVGAACPQGYCIKRPVNISLAGLIETDEQCASNRSGVLCGGCAEGLSLVFGSSKCQQCSNYFLFLVVPFLVAGIALVAFILLTNMTIATGTIHGLTFYANIVAIGKSLFFPFEKPNFLTVFISWLNLDLGIETCFYNGMDAYEKLMLQLVFPAYLFLLILVFMFLHNRSTILARIVGKLNPEVTLYTLILLSYSKLIRIIIAAVQFTTLTYPDGKRIVWFYDGNVEYTNTSQIPRFIVGIVIIILAALYIITLTCGHVFTRYSEYKLCRFTTHRYYIHFMNAHHAPLDDNHRYWVGMLLLLKLLFYMFSTVFYANVPVVGMMSACLAFVMILLKLPNKAYVNRWTNYLELSFYINLFILSLVVANAAIYISRDLHILLAYVSMSIVFISFIVMTIWHTCGKCFKKAYENLKVQKENTSRLSKQEESKPLLSDASTQRRTTAYDTASSCQSRLPYLDILSPVKPEDYHKPQPNFPSRPKPMTSFVDIS